MNIEITTPNNNIITNAQCMECKGGIWAIAELTLIIGCERPILLHAVCYERLKEIEFMYKGLCK